MDIIQFKAANCKNCYKCIRHCDVKSITFSDNQARILDDECVLCGKCTIVCPQNAKQVHSDLSKVHTMLDSGKRVYVSLAPSFPAAFPGASFAQVTAALLKLGFAGVEETAIGATQVTAEYSRLMEQADMPNIITTCCPSVNLLVEKHFPDLLPILAPVPSPAIAHAKLLRKAYGSDIAVVFIGPCISKKYEAMESGEIDAVLLYDELLSWLSSEGISVPRLSDNAAAAAPMEHTKSRFYPIPGGVLKTLPESVRSRYRLIAIDGLDRCIEVLQDIRQNRITGYMVEMSSCVNSCVGGPGLHENRRSFLLTKGDVASFAGDTTRGRAPLSEECAVDMHHTYVNLQQVHPLPTESEIQQVLLSMNKKRKEDMLNCGACGYNTCREKAIAVCQGKANPKMCLPFMRQKAESMANIVIDNTPNGLIVLDSEFNIVQFNRSAAALLNLDNTCIGMEVDFFLDMSQMKDIASTGHDIMGVRCKTAIYDALVEQSIVALPEHEYLMVLKDISAEEESMREMQKMRQETIATAQSVIDKQMRVAQEIASLLGETTGETKAALLKLKESIGGQQ